MYIDEAQDYFDDSLEIMLATARKFRVGLIMAHQTLGQLPAKLRQTMMTNTSIKLIGGVSAQDAAAFGAEIQEDPKKIMAVKKHTKITEFVCWVRNGPPTFILDVPLLKMEQQPKITKKELETMLANNRRLYGQAVSEMPDQSAGAQRGGFGGACGQVLFPAAALHGGICFIPRFIVLPGGSPQ